MTIPWLLLNTTSKVSFSYTAFLCQHTDANFFPGTWKPENERHIGEVY